MVIIIVITIITVTFSYFSRWFFNHQLHQTRSKKCPQRSYVVTWLAARPRTHFSPHRCGSLLGRTTRFCVAGEWLGMAGNIWIKTWGEVMFWCFIMKKHVFKDTEITVSRIVLRRFSNHQAEQIPLVLAWTSVDTIYLICSRLKARVNWTVPVVLMVCSWLSSDHMVVACCGWNEADKHPYLFSMTESKPKSPSRKSSFSGHSKEPFLTFVFYLVQVAFISCLNLPHWKLTQRFARMVVYPIRWIYSWYNYIGIQWHKIGCSKVPGLFCLSQSIFWGLKCRQFHSVDIARFGLPTTSHQRNMEVHPS